MARLPFFVLQEITMYDVVLSCIRRIRQLQELPMDHEPSRDELWDFIVEMDGVLRLAVTSHPDFEKQLREVLNEWGTNDLVECCLDGGITAEPWIGIFAEQADSLEFCKLRISNIQGLNPCAKGQNNG